MNLKKHLTINPIRLFVMLVATYLIVMPIMVCCMIYYPDKEKAIPFEKVENIFISTPDNVKLNAWYVKAKNNKPTVIFCHGNGGNISYYQYILDVLASKGYGILLFDYRGYGESSGIPTEKGLYTDLNSVVSYLENSEKIPQNKIILWGLSLGGAVVTEIASHNQFKAVILQSTFTCIRDEAIDKTTQLKGFLFRDAMKLAAEHLIYYQKYDTIDKINKISCPLLIAHSKNDNVVSYKNSLRLAKIKPKAQLYISNSGGHNEHEWVDGEALKFLNSLK